MKFKKGRVPWNKGKPYLAIRGDKNGRWKGDDVGYYALHDWVRSKAGIPKVCKHCGGTNKVQWANMSGKYKRDLTDWMTLCYWCHRKYDFPERPPCKCGKKYYSKGLCQIHYDKARYLRLKNYAKNL